MQNQMNNLDFQTNGFEISKIAQRITLGMQEIRLVFGGPFVGNGRNDFEPELAVYTGYLLWTSIHGECGSLHVYSSMNLYYLQRHLQSNSISLLLRLSGELVFIFIVSLVGSFSHGWPACATTRVTQRGTLCRPIDTRAPKNCTR